MDFNRVGLLLHVVKETREQPKLSRIYNEAMAELQGINDQPTQKSEPQPRSRVPIEPRPTEIERKV